MMTRDEFMKNLRITDDKWDHGGLSEWANTIAQHDAEQRAEIERLKHRVERGHTAIDDANRYQWLTTDHGSRDARRACREILTRMQGMSYSAASTDIDALRKAYSTAEYTEDNSLIIIRTLREALVELHATVIGECPSLLHEDSGGNATLALQIEQVLKETQP